MNRDELNKILAKHKLWLEGKPGGERADLSNTDLRNVDLRNADLSYADLSNAVLCDAVLYKAVLRYAVLRFADLRNAVLRFADLCDADLRFANLCDAVLSGADLRNAFLDCVNMEEAHLRNVIGNGKEIQTYQCDKYTVNITADSIQIGCKRHTHEEWLAFSDEEISAMGDDALAWRSTWKPIIEQILKARQA